MKKVPDFSSAKGTPARAANKDKAIRRDQQMPTAEKVGTTVLAAAALMASPLTLVPPATAGQSSVVSHSSPPAPNETTKAAGQEGTLIIRMERTFTVLGVGDGHTVFKDFEGATFYIDPATGDKQTVAADYFLALDERKDARGTVRIKFTNVMIVSILGADAHGNTVMRNARNETFTLDPRTGTKVLIKWPK